MSKKNILIIGISVLIVIGIITGCVFVAVKSSENNGDKKTSVSKLPNLPLPEVTGGSRGELGIDKNINEETIDNYLNRSDSVYRDMRMLADPGNYEAIGGDSKLSGYVDGFEVIPLPYIIPVNDLPQEVGDTYKGKTLFSITSDGKYVANYEESMDFIEKYFPKDKYIFLMCGGGGYAGSMKKFLVSLGWDENMIYNVGGYWYYNGKHNIVVKKVEDDKITYDFDKVPYIEIKFDTLTPISTTSNITSNKVSNTTSNVTSNKISNVNSNSNSTVNSNKIKLDSVYYNGYVDKEYDRLDKEANDKNDECLGIDSDKEKEKHDKCFLDVENLLKKKAQYVDALLDKKASFIIKLYPGSTCYSGSLGNNIFDNFGTFVDKYKIYSYQIGLGVFKYTKLSSQVKYAPSVVIINKGQLMAYTDPNNDTKLIKDYNEFENWITQYIIVK